MKEEINSIVDEYLDRFLASDIVLIKINDQKYPINTLKDAFLKRIKHRGLKKVSAYMFLQELYLEKI